MSSVEKQPVPLGGSRVPESMGGSSCPPWQELPEQTQQQTEALGAAGNAVMTLRENIGSLKKQLSGLAPPMKEFIYSAGQSTPTFNPCLSQKSPLLSLSLSANISLCLSLSGLLSLSLYQHLCPSQSPRLSPYEPLSVRRFVSISLCLYLPQPSCFG